MVRCWRVTSLTMGIAESWRRARWLRVVVAGVRRHGPVLRVTAAVLAALGLGGVAVAGSGAPVGAQQGEAGDQAETDRRAATSIIFTEPRFAPGVAPHIRVGERFKIEIHDVPQGVTAHIYLTGPIQPEGRCRARGATGAAAPRRVGPGPSTGSGYYDGMKIDGCAVGTGNIRVVNADESERYATASIAVRAGTTSPTPTPMPTPTPRPTAAPPPQPPPDTGVPSFGTAEIAHQLYHAGQAIAARQLPEVRGGDDPVSYSITRAGETMPTLDLGNGLMFDAATRTISGTPTAAVSRATYVYTATDQDGETAHISFDITVFDVTVRVGGYPLAGSTWGVLEFALGTFREPIARTRHFEFQVRLPASTGLQVDRHNSASCTWPAAPPTASQMLKTGWIQPPWGFRIGRCGLGAGGNFSVEVWSRVGDRGAPVRLYAVNMSIPRAWHRHDHIVSYYIRGAGGTAINGVATGTQEGLFPASSSTPNPALTTLANYRNAAHAWNVVPMGGVTIGRVTSAAGADVVIEGYWEAERSAGGKCGGIACVHFSGANSHLGNTPMYLEERARRTGRAARDWTTEFLEWSGSRHRFQYLPAVLTHEFGHTFGIEDNGGIDIMSGRVRELEPCTAPIPSPEPDRCGLSDSDKNGTKAIYAHHPPP